MIIENAVTFAYAQFAAKQESQLRHNIPIYIFWDGVDEYGIVAEANKEKFLSIYPQATLKEKYLNGNPV